LQFLVANNRYWGLVSKRKISTKNNQINYVSKRSVSNTCGHRRDKRYVSIFNTISKC